MHVKNITEFSAEMKCYLLIMCLLKRYFLYMIHNLLILDKNWSVIPKDLANDHLSGLPYLSLQGVLVSQRNILVQVDRSPGNCKPLVENMSPVKL